MTIEPYPLGELAIDAIGLWQFGQQSRYPNEPPEEVERFVRETVKRLLIEGGAWPVRGSRGTDYTWRPIYEDRLGSMSLTYSPDNYNRELNKFIDIIMAEWEESNRNPDFGNVWFARPFLYNWKSSKYDDLNRPYKP